MVKRDINSSKFRNGTRYLREDLDITELRYGLVRYLGQLGERRCYIHIRNREHST